ncbi:hypothetical protein M0802_013851 [Mischocyttarus mexicanus]|nr:hypothetical protein M0802_013851 [Mischocyttarus mexicanus]
MKASRVAIRINGLLAYALLDTGNEVSIINSGLYDKLRRPRLYETTRRLAGFGNAITKPIGRCEVNIDIEGGIYKTDVFVVSQSVMSYEVLLERELLKELDVRISKGRVEIRRPDKRLSEENIFTTTSTTKTKELCSSEPLIKIFPVNGLYDQGRDPEFPRLSYKSVRKTHSYIILYLIFISKTHRSRDYHRGSQQLLTTQPSSRSKDHWTFEASIGESILALLATSRQELPRISRRNQRINTQQAAVLFTS